MILVIPTGHSDAVVRRIPWATIIIAALCLLVQVWSTLGPSDGDLEAYIVEREMVEEQILDEYGLFEVPFEEQEAFLEAYAVGEEGDPDDALREEYRAVLGTGERLEADSPIGRMGYRPADDGVLRMLSSAFVHGGWLHLLGNLLFLYLVGCNLEDRWTRGGFVAFYLAGALVSALSYGLAHPGSHVALIGASGAVSAAMGAFLVVLGTADIRFSYFVWVLYHIRAGSFSARAYVALPIWFLLQALNAGLETLGVEGGVAYSAHVGGFVFGVVVGGVMRWSGWDAKLEERDDEVLFDAARGIGGATGLSERLRSEVLSPQLTAEVDRHLQDAARRGQSREILRIHQLVAQRGDMLLEDRSLLAVAQAAAELGESALAISTVGTLMQHYPRSPLLPRALWDAAEIQRQAGRADLERKTLHNLVRMFPDDPFAQQARLRLG